MVRVRLAILAGFALQTVCFLVWVSKDLPVLLLAALPYLFLLIPTLRPGPPRRAVWAVAVGVVAVTALGALAVSAFVSDGSVFAGLTLVLGFVAQLLAVALAALVAVLARHPAPVPAVGKCAACGASFDGLTGAATCPSCSAERERREAADAASRMRERLDNLPPLGPPRD